MSKRRRVESGDYGGSGGWQQAQHQNAQQYGPALVPSFGSSGGGVEYASAAAAGGATQDAVGAATLNEAPESSNQWSGPGGSSYPDVSSYSQQPYFYQQTDPSNYNSRWPPAETASLGTQPDSYSLPAPSAAMPFFPPHAPAEPSESTFEAANVSQPSFQNYQQEIDVPSQYAYVQQSSSNEHPRSEMHSQTSAFLYEDASMHLKIQSLPILENLVCTRPYNVPVFVLILTNCRRRNLFTR